MNLELRVDALEKKSKISNNKSTSCLKKDQIAISTNTCDATNI